MARLTEEMVIARTRQSNLAAIKKLNCWGSDLVDVSLLRRITNVEVLSLSVNKIASLADFQYCRSLQELFVRKNNIRDLNQVCYLQDLPKLRNLWLDENPCANCEGYRLAVIRCLPHLEKLDNVSVLPEEVQDALRRGRELIHPEEDRHSPERNRGEEEMYASDEMEDFSPAQNAARIEQRKSSSPEEEYYETERRESSAREYSPEPTNTRSSVQNYQNQPHYKEDGVVDQEEKSNREIHSLNSSQSCDDQYTQQYQHQQPQPHQEQHQNQQHHQQYYERRASNTSRPPCSVEQSRGRPMNHQPPYHRRPTTRNSNILSAVLCLVKELDYPSLEVVEMAVRCRMDELED